jgi:2-dehydro-3-deoxy-L-rhamnonate dehydrogenase (NAD+)
MSAPARLAQYDFSGRVAVVTGAAGGIGRAVCDAFARNGAAAVNWDRVPGAQDTPDAPRYFAVDITRPGSIEAALAATLDAYGRIDYLVNNAGFAGPTLPLDEYDPLEWQRVIDVNLVGTYHVSRFVVPVMRRANAGDRKSVV